MRDAIPATTVSDISVREPVRTTANARLIDVVIQIRDHRRGAAIVEDDAGQLIGIFTERDLMLRVNHASFAWHDIEIGEVMTREPTCVTSDTSLTAALARMCEGRFRHLPVLDGSGRATGLVSIRDILSHLVEYFPGEFINLPPDPEHEARGQWGG